MMWHMDAAIAMELERKDLDQRLPGPREVGLFYPDAEAEDEELAEIDLMEPDGLTFAEFAIRRGRLGLSHTLLLVVPGAWSL
jgi:hypothetical protein